MTAPIATIAPETTPTTTTTTWKVLDFLLRLAIWTFFWYCKLQSKLCFVHFALADNDPRLCEIGLYYIAVRCEQLQLEILQYFFPINRPDMKQCGKGKNEGRRRRRTGKIDFQDIESRKRKGTHSSLQTHHTASSDISFEWTRPTNTRLATTHHQGNKLYNYIWFVFM